VVTGPDVRVMSPFEFTIREAESEAERVEVSRLLGSEFDARPGVGKVFQQIYVDVLAGWGPPANSRVAISEDQVVGHTLLVPRTFWFDGIEIPGGIVAMVVVSPRMRGKCACSRCRGPGDQPGPYVFAHCRGPEILRADGLC
jgi:hypothetical protein